MVKNINYIILLLLLIFFLLIFFLIFFTKPVSNITGGATSAASTAGEVEAVNVSLTEASGYWQAFYGEIFEGSSFSQTPSAAAQGGGAAEFNATFPCRGEEIYASTRSLLDFGDVSAGRKETLNHYLQLNASHLESGSQIFANTKTFTVGSSAIADVPTTYTKVFGSPGNATFDLGLLNSSNSLVFVSHISLDTKGFDNKTHDYQMMVPVNSSSVVYYFFSDCEVNVTVPVAPLPLRGGVCWEDWRCGNWSECISGQQTRICRDLNMCETTENKPVEKIFCAIEVYPLEEVEEGEKIELPRNITEEKELEKALPMVEELPLPLVGRALAYFKGMTRITPLYFLLALIIFIAVLLFMLWRRKRYLVIKSVIYNQGTKSFEIILENKWKKKVYADVKIVNLIVARERVTLGAEQQKIKPRQRNLFKIKVLLKKADIENNLTIKVRVKYGKREGILLKVMMEEFDFAFKKT